MSNSLDTIKWPQHTEGWSKDYIEDKQPHYRKSEVSQRSSINTLSSLQQSSLANRGEKSFQSISLRVAIWAAIGTERMEFPFSQGLRLKRVTQISIAVLIVNTIFLGTRAQNENLEFKYLIKNLEKYFEHLHNVTGVQTRSFCKRKIMLCKWERGCFLLLMKQNTELCDSAQIDQ